MDEKVHIPGNHIRSPESEFTAENMNYYTKKCIEEKYANDIKQINRKIHEAAKEGKFSTKIRVNDKDFRLIRNYYLDRSFKLEHKFDYMVIYWH
ncbi:hypothetical protein [Staphylococcus chromogenes]|uniref:hypothetical protein n=1 Tax=Staphylococcus chromogenes TaxID=46126 RepID=UPI0028872F56|nr:hypothetical protein [Staphylococcus chromogenes]MDT0700333.1 hypothetical protein [Staphylococcus chromogenes]